MNMNNANYRKTPLPNNGLSRSTSRAEEIKLPNILKLDDAETTMKPLNRSRLYQSFGESDHKLDTIPEQGKFDLSTSKYLFFLSY